MTFLKIQDAPLKTSIVGDEKIPTGGYGDLAISVQQIKDFTALAFSNVDNTSDANKPVSVATQAALDLKANVSDVNTALALKSDKTYVDEQLVLKASKIYVDTELQKTASKIYVDGQLASKATNTYVDSINATKANISYVDSELALKADITYVDNELANKTHNSLVGRDVANAHPASAILDASGKTQQEINDILKNNVVNVINFGAKPQSGFDNRDAFEAAGAYLESIGGGTLYIPDGVFEFHSVFGSNNCCIKVRANIVYAGNGISSVLKFGNGLNADKSYGCTFIFPPESSATTDTSNVRVFNLKFDHNGQNNIMTQPPSLYPFTTGGQAVGVQHGDNIVIENCYFIDNAGRQTIMIGKNAATPTVKKSIIRNNIFINCGKSVTGNTSQTDHSSVYSICEESDVYENLFFNTSADTVSTAIELHGTRPKAWRNNIYNYGQAFNLAAVIANMNLGCFENNHVENCAHIGTIWAYSGLSLSTKITDNTFVINIANQTQINGITNIQSGVVKNSHTIDENTIIYGGGYTDADYSSFVDIAYLTRLAFRRNKIPEGYAGRAVNISSAKADAVVILKGNDMQGVAGTSRAGYEECFWINSGTTSNIKHLTVTDNSAVDCDKYLYTIPNVAATFNNLSERNNTISKTMTDVANIGASVVLGARAAMIDRVTNRISARASQGSRILDTTTGKRYVKAVNDETSTGWVEDFYSISVGSGTWLGSTLAANSSRTTTITVSNSITVDNLISFVFPAPLQGTIITAEYQDATTVKLTQYNPTASALTFANAVVKVRVS